MTFPLKDQKTLRAFLAFENKIWRQKIVFDNLDFNDRCWKKIEDDNEKYSILSEKVSQKIGFTACDFHGLPG